MSKSLLASSNTRTSKDFIHWLNPTAHSSFRTCPLSSLKFYLIGLLPCVLPRIPASCSNLSKQNQLSVWRANFLIGMIILATSYFFFNIPFLKRISRVEIKKNVSYPLNQKYLVPSKKETTRTKIFLTGFFVIVKYWGKNTYQQGTNRTNDDTLTHVMLFSLRKRKPSLYWFEKISRI